MAQRDQGAGRNRFVLLLLFSAAAALLLAVFVGLPLGFFEFGGPLIPPQGVVDTPAPATSTDVPPTLTQTAAPTETETPEPTVAPTQTPTPRAVVLGTSAEYMHWLVSRSEVYSGGISLGDPVPVESFEGTCFGYAEYEGQEGLPVEYATCIDPGEVILCDGSHYCGDTLVLFAKDEFTSFTELPIQGPDSAPSVPFDILENPYYWVIEVDTTTGETTPLVGFLIGHSWPEGESSEVLRQCTQQGYDYAVSAGMESTVEWYERFYSSVRYHWPVSIGWGAYVVGSGSVVTDSSGVQTLNDPTARVFAGYISWFCDP